MTQWRTWLQNKKYIHIYQHFLSESVYYQTFKGSHFNQDRNRSFFPFESSNGLKFISKAPSICLNQCFFIAYDYWKCAHPLLQYKYLIFFHKWVFYIKNMNWLPAAHKYWTMKIYCRCEIWYCIQSIIRRVFSLDSVALVPRYDASVSSCLRRMFNLCWL